MPAVKPTLLLDFAATRQLDHRCTFTRASAARTSWCYNRRGVLVPQAVNEPAFQHNPLTLESLGLWMREQRTELALHNRDLTNAAWTKTTITATKDQTGADGVASSASRIAATAANGTVLQSITSASAQRVAAPLVRRLVGTGTVEFTIDNGATWTPVTLTTSWLEITPIVATVTNPVIGFRLANSGDEIAVDFVGVQSGATFLGHIETTTAQVTRTTDALVISGANFTSFFNPAQGTIVCRFMSDTSFAGSVRRAWEIGAGGTANRLLFGQNNSTTINYVVTAASVSQVATSISATAGLSTNTAVSYLANDFRAAANGASAAVDSVGTVPAVTQLHIGSDFAAAAASMLNGTLARLAYYPIALTGEISQLCT